MRSAVLALVVLLIVGRPSHAAPWSFDLPAGYTEVPGAADTQLAQLRRVPSTVSVDVQVYISDDGEVQLTRLTWLSKFHSLPDRRALQLMERGMVSGSSKAATAHISDEQHFVHHQLVAESIDMMGDVRVHQRRLYAVDSARLVHMFSVVCTGPEEGLAECEHAQQSMVLSVPDQVPLVTGPPPPPNSHMSYQIGQLIGFLVLVVLIGLWIKSGAPIFRRKKRAPGPP